MISPSKKLLKQLIAVGCFESALVLLNMVEIPHTNHIFLKTYL